MKSIPQAVRRAFDSLTGALRFRRKSVLDNHAEDYGSYCFRILFCRSPREKVDVEASSVEILTDCRAPTVKLSSYGAGESIKESRELILSACGYRSEAGAERAGRVVKQALALAAARARIGVDFRSRGPSSAVTPAGLQYFAGLLNLEGPVAPDKYGLVTYKRLAGLHFIKMGDMNSVVTKPLEELAEPLRVFVDADLQLSAMEEVAFEFYNASFFQASADARFLLLMTAIEALIDPAKRSTEARKHVDTLIAATRANESMPDAERTSIEGSLCFLKDESFRQAGKRIVAARLGDREYEGKTAEKYFSDCYNLRSRLVHGKDPIPTWAEVNQANGALERFVSDLLTVPWDQSDLDGHG